MSLKFRTKKQLFNDIKFLQYFNAAFFVLTILYIIQGNYALAIFAMLFGFILKIMEGQYKLIFEIRRDKWFDEVLKNGP